MMMRGLSMFAVVGLSKREDRKYPHDTAHMYTISRARRKEKYYSQVRVKPIPG